MTYCQIILYFFPLHSLLAASTVCHHKQMPMHFFLDVSSWSLSKKMCIKDEKKILIYSETICTSDPWFMLGLTQKRLCHIINHIGWLKSWSVLLHNFKWHENGSTTFDHVERYGLWFCLVFRINVVIKNDKLWCYRASRRMFPIPE